MNDPILMAQKLGSLAKLASAAHSDFEKAAVFAAAETIATAFNSSESNFGGYALENVEKARWHICAMVGYDVTNGLDKALHASAATSAANALERIVSSSK